MLDAVLGREVVERSVVAPVAELLAPQTLDEIIVGIAIDGDPVAARAPAVLGGRRDGRGDVRRQRPGRRRPDDQRLTLALAAQRKAHVQGRVLELDVVLLARLLVLRERGAAAGTPLRRAVPLVQPAALVDVRKEPPDV